MAASYEGWMTFVGQEVVSALRLLEKPKESDTVDVVEVGRTEEHGPAHSGPGSKQQQEAFVRSRLGEVRCGAAHGQLARGQLLPCTRTRCAEALPILLH